MSNLNGTLSIQNDYLILKNDYNYDEVSSIDAIQESITGSGTLKKEFRWSKDNVSFSNFIPLTLSNLQTLIPYSTSNFYLEYRYELLDSVETTINSVSIDITKSGTKWDNFLPFPIVFREKGNRYSPLVTKPFSLNIHNVDFQARAINLYKDLNYAINNLHGQEVFYSRSVPVLESRDAFLGNYSLFQSSDPMKIKVILTQNEFPDNKFNMGLFGADFEMFPEVQIDKRYFEWIFGNSTGPQRGDVLYFPINDRFYQIQSSTLDRKFMAVPSYWRIQLEKWDPKHSIKSSPEFAEILDRYTVSSEEIFGSQINSMEKDISPDFYIKPKSKHDDPIRNFIVNTSIIKSSKLENYDLLISNHYYDLSQQFFIDNNPSTSINYNVVNETTTSNDITYTSWFKEVDGNSTSNRKVSSVTFLTSTTLKIQLPSDVPVEYVEGNYLKFYVTNNTSFYLNGLIDSVDLVKRQVVVIVDSVLLTIANGTLNNWNTNSNLYISASIRRNLLDNYDIDTNKGLTLDIFDSRMFKIKTNTTIRYIDLTTNISTLYGNWLGVIFTFSNRFKQISLNIYKMDNTDSSSDLIPVFESITNNISQLDLSNSSNFKLLSSCIHLRNIRILTDIIPEEHHSDFLNQNIIQDSSRAIIVDNCLPRLKATFIENPK